MAITFPSSPSAGDIFTSNGKSWQYVNGKWEAYGEIIAPDVFSVDEVNNVVNVYGSLSAGASASIASDLVVDTNTLVVDSTNNRVGVGTSTPTKQVSVESNSTNIFNVDSTTAFDPFLGENVTSPRVGIGVDNPSNELEVGGNIRAESVQVDFNGVVFNTANEAVTLRGVDSSISFRTSGSENVVIDGSGNVGIGTTSPTERLNVATVSGSAYIKQENGTATTYLGPDSANTGLFGTSTAHDVRFITSNIERMRIDSSGNVGIGITNPLNELHIQDGSSGATADTGTYTQFVVEDSTNAGIHLISPDTGVGRVMMGTPSRQFGSLMRWDYPNRTYDIATDISGGEIAFRTGTFAERMRIDSSGRVTMPYQPSFEVTRSSGFSSGQIVPYNTENYDNGNNFSSSRFTAPVTGVYFFYWTNIGLNGSGDVHRYTLRINGTNTNKLLRLDQTTFGGGYIQGTQTAIVYLTASDYVEVYYVADSGSNSYGNNAYTRFGGYLLG